MSAYQLTRNVHYVSSRLGGAGQNNVGHPCVIIHHNCKFCTLAKVRQTQIHSIGDVEASLAAGHHNLLTCFYTMTISIAH